MFSCERAIKHYLRQARDREQEGEGLLDRAIKLTEEADQLRAKAGALVRELAAASDSGPPVDEPE